MTKKTTIPANFISRIYQKLFFYAAENQGFKRLILVWPRRHGKDKTCFAFIIREMCRRIGNYAYIFPTASLARKAAWQNIDADGFKLLDHIPKELIAKKQDQQMHIELVNGSTLTFFGSDRQISVGTNYVGIIFSEFALQDPTAWNLLRPVLRQNNGWAVFNSTPRGRNHFYEMWEMAQENDEWFCSRLTADDTDVFTAEDIQAERDSGMSEEMIQQEFFTSFNRGVEGSFFGKDIDLARRQCRIGTVYPQDVLTHAAFDLGMNDSTAIWVWQVVGNEIHFIDYYENNGESISHYVAWLNSKKYFWGEIWLPHDAQVRELSTGHSRIETFQNLGIDVTIAPNIGILDGIEVVRQTLPRCWFDEERCKKGLEALECYHKEWNPKYEVYRDRPVHDKYSHGCFIAGTMIATDQGDKRIENISIGDRVLTPLGYRAVKQTYEYLVDNIITIKFNNAELTCTDNHLFFTDKGLVHSDALRYDDIVYTKSLLSRLLCRIKYMYMSMKTGSRGYKKTILSATTKTALSSINVSQKHDEQMEKISSKEHALSAEKYFTSINMLLHERVLKSVEQKVPKTRVYDFTVDKHNCYYANGILVSNSDAMRYACLGITQNTGATKSNISELNRTKRVWL